MNLKLMAVSVALFIPLTACEQKADLAAKPIEAGREVAQKTQEFAAQEAKELTKKAQESAQKISNDASKAAKDGVEVSKDGAKKSALVVKETAEQTLAETVGHAQEITKTQKSESRQHGQKAEDEMMMEIEKQK